jgi:hypothetical protein
MEFILMAILIAVGGSVWAGAPRRNPDLPQPSCINPLSLAFVLLYVLGILVTVFNL